MRAIVAFLAAVVGSGLLRVGVVNWGLGFLAVGAALAAWRARLTPLRKIEAALALALVLTGAAHGHPLEGTLSALIAGSLIELARIFT